MCGVWLSCYYLCLPPLRTVFVPATDTRGGEEESVSVILSCSPGRACMHGEHGQLDVCMRAGRVADGGLGSCFELFCGHPYLPRTS